MLSFSLVEDMSHLQTLNCAYFSNSLLNARCSLLEYFYFRFYNTFKTVFRFLDELILIQVIEDLSL